jgi:hypothetical protein
MLHITVYVLVCFLSYLPSQLELHVVHKSTLHSLLREVGGCLFLMGVLDTAQEKIKCRTFIKGEGETFKINM